ncbi:MAG: hypothetical protein AB7U83_04210 [Vicinamibacterales bacterium]
MRAAVVALFASCVIAMPAIGAAQDPPARPAAPAATSAIDPSALGISMSRISRQLRLDQQARRQGDSPLKLEYFVDVYGTAPALRFFSGPELLYGAVPGSAPSHREMLYQLTPQAFRSPRVDFLGLAYAAASAGARKAQDWRYERDLRAYQKLIESGRMAPAPQPPRR